MKMKMKMSRGFVWIIKYVVLQLIKDWLWPFLFLRSREERNGKIFRREKVKI